MNTKSKLSQATKLRILNATYDLIRDEGIHALSSGKIVKAAQVSKGGFFHHFPQMEDLYLFMLEQMIQQMEQSFLSESFESLTEFIQVATEYTLQAAKEAPEFSCSIFYFLAQCQHKPVYKEQLKNMLETTFTRWVELLEPSFPAILTHQEKQDIVRMLDMYFCGLNFHYLILCDPNRQREVSSKFAYMLEHTLLGDK